MNHLLLQHQEYQIQVLFRSGSIVDIQIFNRDDIRQGWSYHGPFHGTSLQEHALSKEANNHLVFNGLTCHPVSEIEVIRYILGYLKRKHFADTL